MIRQADIILIILCAALICCNKTNKNGNISDPKIIIHYDSIISRAKNSIPDSAIVLYKQAVALAEKTGMTNEAAKANIELAKALIYSKDDFQRAKATLDSISQDGLDKHTIASLNLAYGEIYRTSDTAVNYYKNALFDSASLNAKQKTSIYNNLSTIFFSSGDFEEAKNYALAALRYVNNAQSKAKIFNNLHLIELGLKDTLAANAYLKSAALLVQDSLPDVGDINIYQNLGKMYLRLHKIDSAVFYFREFEKIIQRDYDDEFLFYPNLYLATAYIEEGNFSKGAIFLKQATTYCQPDSLGDEIAQKEFYDNSYKLQSAQGNVATAFSFLKKSNYYSSVLNEKSNSNNLLKFRKQINEAYANKKLAEKDFYLKRQKIINVSLVGLSILLAVIFFQFYKIQKRKKDIEIKQLKIKEQQTTLEYTKKTLDIQSEERRRISQELHDELGSAISSISMATGVLKLHELNPKISQPLEILSSASDDLGVKVNEIVWSLNERNDTAKSLSAYIRNFAATFLGQAGIKLNYKNDLEKDFLLHGHIRRILYQSAKELLNNVVKHSTANEVYLQISKQSNTLTITISDNGGDKKFSLVKAVPSGGNGLKNIEENLKSIGGNFSIKKKNGFSVELSIPI